ncbi:hypothetical protein PUN28_002831 [Cardiocondyla obscurior]|uniref:Uncharacterized protein n=1 Tax=Cardiocondyla obscurior TaxID=286306 RepID=A0AAW2GW78_9HYME
MGKSQTTIVPANFVATITKEAWPRNWRKAVILGAAITAKPNLRLPENLRFPTRFTHQLLQQHTDFRGFRKPPLSERETRTSSSSSRPRFSSRFEQPVSSVEIKDDSSGSLGKNKQHEYRECIIQQMTVTKRRKEGRTEGWKDLIYLNLTERYKCK